MVFGQTVERSTSGRINGLIGVIIFSCSLPATKVAVAAFDPMFLTGARAVIAGLIGLMLLMVFRQRRPGRQDLMSLIIVALGVVVGFPLLTALALQHMRAAIDPFWPFEGVLTLLESSRTASS